MCFSCVSLLVMPIFCMLETIARLVMTIVFAAEDILRLLIKAIHSWASIILHTLAIVPMWFVFCCSQKCFCYQICNPICSPACSPACYPMRNNCGCLLFLSVILVFILVYLFTNWWEDMFATFGFEFPCFYDKKADVTKLVVENKNKSEPMMAKLEHKRDQSTRKSVQGAHKDNRHTTKSKRPVRNPTTYKPRVNELNNGLEVYFIDHLKGKENASKRTVVVTNFTYVTVTVNAILEEHDDETLR